MALKFQVQFAGINFKRPSSPHRKWLRTGLLTLMVVLAVLAYWQYLHHLIHGSWPMAAHAVPAVSRPAASNPDSSAVPPAATLPPMLRQAADDSVAAVGNYMLRTLRISPAVPVATAVPREPIAASVPIPIVAPTVSVVPTPAAPPPCPVYTEQERLLMAGQTVFTTVINLANKYPDAYGFQAGDVLSDAKLGGPMPVYTIEESDRASYQAGQPVRPLLQPARQWVFPVLMGDRICCMVSVRQTGRNYIPGTGSKSLAMAWNKILDKWPADKGYHPLLVVNPDIPGYYFTVPELPVSNITDTIEMFFLHPVPSPADVILASWR